MEGSPVSPVHRFKETNIRPQILVCFSSCSIYETTAILYLPKLGRCTDAKFLFESMSQLASASTAIEAAFKLLEQTVSDDHKRDFYSTELKDVRQAALDIEKWQRPRRSLRNMARIEPLLAGIQQYAGPLETLCQGTPYLPFIWVSFHGSVGCFRYLFDYIGSNQIDATGTNSIARPNENLFLFPNPYTDCISIHFRL